MNRLIVKSLGLRSTSQANYTHSSQQIIQIDGSLSGTAVLAQVVQYVARLGMFLRNLMASKWAGDSYDRQLVRFLEVP
jgi:hypothetical protein